MMNAKARLQELKDFNVDRADLDEMILIERDLSSLRAAYETRSLPVAEWISDQISTVNAEIVRRTHDDLERRLKELDRHEASLLSATEKRERIAREREQIQARLRGETPQPA